MQDDAAPPQSIPVPPALEAVPPELLQAGFSLVRDFITLDEEHALLAAIDGSPWDTTIRRRTQHYGSRFDYTTKAVAHADDTPSGTPNGMPAWLGWVVARASMYEPLRKAWGHLTADQVTVNDYQPAVGISAHVDTHSAFHDGIASLSLQSGCALRMLRPGGTAADAVVVWLPPRSLFALTDAARYEWRHGIPGRKYDVVSGEFVPRQRRVSITLRRVLASGTCSCGFPQQCDSQGRAVELPTRLG